MKSLAPVAATPACLLKLRASLRSLPVHHARIAHFAMLNPAAFLDLDAREIAYQCSTSEATVVRFCQRMGYHGLSEMKKVLALELAAKLVPHSAAGSGNAGDQKKSSRRVFFDCGIALQDTVSCADHATMDHVATAIANSEILYLFGAGGSAHIAQQAALNFLTLGFRTVAFVDPIQQLAAAKLVTARDVAIAVTYSGNQKDVAVALQSARERKALCVAITSFEQSLISKSADRLLLIATPSETLRGESGVHRVAQIAVLDALAVRAAELRTKAAKGQRVKERKGGQRAGS
ncbi:MAG TPA: MurR/RpiR family transcriptional regulator [Candidatus Eisenbacteria bacterium]|nr:MurR/RpiR family transcriptional regulator [Candidatus Eisenbacteria bacterium]